MNKVTINPLLVKYQTPHETIPFEQIKNEHYMPAFREAMKQHLDEIYAIIDNDAIPTFENTIETYEKAGELLSKVSSPFYNLQSAETNDELELISQELSPVLSEHSNKIRLNEKLFAKIKTVYDTVDKNALSVEQQMLLKKTYEGFERNGVNLPDEKKLIYKELSKTLSLATLQFGQNTLKATNKYSLLIEDVEMLKGLPNDVLAMLQENAEKTGKKGWLLTLKATSYLPVMKYADNRELRHELYMASATKCIGGEFDNQDLVKQIVNTRLQIANLLGYKSYADYALVNRMAENKGNVYSLLEQLLKAYKPVADKEYADLQTYASTVEADFDLQVWDWAYYSEKFRLEKFNISDEILRPYFELEKVKAAVFGLATELYGISFVPNKDIPVYNSEVEAFDVLDEHGEFLSVLYTDFHPRDGKQSGAWMSDYKGQWNENGKDSRPHITIVMNFTRPTDEKPALLTFDEVNTFLHEFGHALHGMLTRCTYESLSGTNVYRDFVELPSQLMENWTGKKEFLDRFAVHYQTGEKIPADLIQKIRDAQNFHAGYACVRQLSFGFLDMDWHGSELSFDGSVVEREQQTMAVTKILPVVEGTAMSTSFGHIFSGGYAAGYYSYKWAEVLDADAFSVFEKNGLFNKEIAKLFRENILEKGGTEAPSILYKRFRGQDASIEALMRRDGILN